MDPFMLVKLMEKRNVVTERYLIEKVIAFIKGNG